MTVAFGLYGKLPSVGDFIGRGFSPELRHALDGLLQSALATAISDGVHPHTLFENAPSFVLSVRPGALCASGFVGGIVPSQDRVGRLFPFCLGLETDAQMQRLPLSWPSLGLSQYLCGLGLGAKAAGATADQVMAELPDAARWQALSGQGVPFASAADETVPRLPSEGSAQCFVGPEAVMSPVDRALCSRLPWSAQVLGIVLDSAGGFDRFFSMKSLSDPAPLAAVFDRQWARRGWVEYGPVAPVPDAPVLVAVPPSAVMEATPVQDAAGTLPAAGGDDTRPLLPRIDKAASPVDDVSRESGWQAMVTGEAPLAGDEPQSNVPQTNIQSA
ncbi:MAG: type VI secretion system-associated protein TagF [Rubrivivax sp.]|nr:type VI secretion system-associated protein TagF [Rubrivivax sp.]